MKIPSNIKAAQRDTENVLRLCNRARDLAERNKEFPPEVVVLYRKLEAAVAKAKKSFAVVRRELESAAGPAGSAFVEVIRHGEMMLQCFRPYVNGPPVRSSSEN